MKDYDDFTYRTKTLIFLTFVVQEIVKETIILKTNGPLAASYMVTW